MNPLIISILPQKPEDDLQEPSITEPGFIIVEVGPFLSPEEKWSPKHEYEVLDYSGGAYWIEDGVGFQYWFDEYCEFPEEGGIFTIVNVRGRWVEYGWETVEYDEAWDFDYIRKVTEQEIQEMNERREAERIIAECKFRAYRFLNKRRIDLS